MMNVMQHTGAFVIQFRAETDVERGRFEGRAEHVASSQSSHFHSLDELLEFLARVLKEARLSQQQQTEMLPDN